MEALITNIQGYSIHDGPGIRTLVFFKGCGLECQWCANPECISPYPEVGFIENLCTGCGKCEGVCPEKALVYEEKGRPHIDRSQCVGCGECVSACSYKALVLYGKRMRLQEVFDLVERDKMFYQSSGGGVTVSGGEPLLQSRFVCDLFEKCREADIHTCIETSGAAPSPPLEEVLKLTDYVLFDLKHQNSSKHRRFTGRPNDTILSNAKLVVQSGVEVLFRMPLIPGLNDNPVNIRKTAAFLKGLGEKAGRIELMPYHRMGESKYRALDRPYTLDGLPPADTARVEEVKQAFEEQGIQCTVSH